MYFMHMCIDFIVLIFSISSVIDIPWTFEKMAQVNGPLLEASKSVKNIYKLKKEEKKKKRELDDWLPN